MFCDNCSLKISQKVLQNINVGTHKKTAGYPVSTQYSGGVSKLTWSILSQYVSLPNIVNNKKKYLKITIFIL